MDRMSKSTVPEMKRHGKTGVFNNGQQRKVTAVSAPIMPRDRLQAMVDDFDEKEKTAFAWKMHCLYNKKIEYWYVFLPPEKYCSSNAFVPIQYNSLLPPGIKKSQIKRETASLVLKKGTQGIHFAIGWQELYVMLLEYGIFANDPFFDDEPKLVPARGRVPELIGFQAAALDLSDTDDKSPTMGSILCETKRYRKATRGIKNYTSNTPSQQETLICRIKRKSDSEPNGEWNPAVQSNSRFTRGSKKARYEQEEREAKTAMDLKPATSGNLNKAAVASTHQQNDDTALHSAVQEDPTVVKDSKTNLPSSQDGNWIPSTPPTPPVQYWLENYAHGSI
ncbi:unnamed protein product [Cylindrotheca closterium]|uniref:Uncharacterized protein n=1 Tax=Cylindrotheca closterium TaxID=2856 RepID=A0AAD2G6H7_9STRA|nr:unnamed protein product [Cylindrotheca closterium]